jgi:hypothetical protein
MRVAKKLMLWLALVLACFLPVSAFVTSIPENHAWEIFSIEYDAAGTPITTGYDGPVKPTSAYNQSPIHSKDTETRSTKAERPLFGPNAEFKAAEGLPAGYRGSPGAMWEGEDLSSTPYEPQLFHVIPDFAGERIGTAITYSPQELAGGSYGNLNYVVTENGELVIGERFDDLGGHHPDLAGGGSVQAAGEVEIVNGQITVLNNGSGHYLPTGPSAQAAAENAFKNAGFEVPPGLYEDFGFK